MVKTEIHLVSGNYLLVQEDLESVNNSVALSRPDRKYLLLLTGANGKPIYVNYNNIEFMRSYQRKPFL